MNTNPTPSEFFAVFATDGNNDTFRVSDPLSWDAAQHEWNKLEDLHRARRLPQAKFFEVRTVFVGPDRPLVGPEVWSHDRYDNAPLNMNMVARVVAGSRGYKNVEDAARAAWKLMAPTFRSWYDKRSKAAPGIRTGVQGRGGWFYWPNGATAAQGLHGLAQVAFRRKMIVQGVNGKWYVVETEVLA